MVNGRKITFPWDSTETGVYLRREEMTDEELKIEKLRYINGLTREMLEHWQRENAKLGIRPTKLPDFVYEEI